jgi:hypothetical protein
VRPKRAFPSPDTSAQVKASDYCTSNDCSLWIAGHPQLVVASIRTRISPVIRAREHRLQFHVRDGLIYIQARVKWEWRDATPQTS